MSTCSITITIRIFLLCFVSTVLFVSCFNNKATRDTRPQQKVVLTRNMLKNYKISPDELNQYQFYLGQKLELQGDTTQYTKALSSRDPNSVDLLARTEKRTVIFPAGTAGRVISTESQTGVTGKYVSLIVDFGPAEGGRNYNLVLRFSPDHQGNYTLDHGWIFNAIRLKRKGIKYHCTDGCWNNYLLISGTESKLQIPTRWQARGNTYYSGESIGRP
jgi:hypothetical protein